MGTPLHAMLGLLLLLPAMLTIGSEARSALPDERPRVALVIGNSDYADMPLANPVNDADLMSATLKTLGFKTIDLRNTTAREMRRGVRDFAEALEKAGENVVSLVYYAGHGMQVGGRNYLIPVDAVIEREADVEVEAFAADAILSAIEYSTTALNIIILDACRNNPFARSFRSASKGLARMDAPRGTLLAYATAPGDVAADGAGANSPYTSALVAQMSRPGLSVEQLFKTVRVSVMQETGERQVPWESSSLTGEFFFGGAQADAAGSAGTSMAADIAAWTTLGTSNDPAVLQAFLDQFPDSALAPIAKARIASLTNPQSGLSSRASARPVPPHQKYDGEWQAEYRIMTGGSVGSACMAGQTLTGTVTIANGELQGNVKSSRAGNAALKAGIREDGRLSGTSLGWDWRPQAARDLVLQEDSGRLVGNAGRSGQDCAAEIVLTRVK